MCRHHTQLTQCGFHVPTSQPYKDLGPVELDDRKLILETLGQIAEDGPEVEVRHCQWPMDVPI